MKKAEIKDRIKIALDLRDLTQSELAEKAHIDKGQLSSYLSGKYKPRQNNIDAISIALGVNEAWLMGFDVPMERNVNVKASSKITLYNVHCETKDEADLVLSYRALNDQNKEKCMTYSKSLLSTQQMEDEVYEVAAAHDMNASPEQKKYADDIMKDPSEWE